MRLLLASRSETRRRMLAAAGVPFECVDAPFDEEAAKLINDDEWNRNTHGRSGLTERVRASTVTEEEATRLILEFLGQYVPPGKSPMCGNSICQDRRFMARWMPTLERFFHYRNLDVSTLK